jgi:hypothetical protein
MLFFLGHGSLEISILPPMKREFPVKLNHEFEANLLRQPAWLFLSPGVVLLEKSILPPKRREFRMDKHRLFRREKRRLTFKRWDRMDKVQNTTTMKTKAMTSSTFIKDNMLIEPSIQKEVIRRAIDGAFGDNPNQAVHFLGTVKVPDGREVPVHLRHAADAILLDDFGHVVLITRKHNPGAGQCRGESGSYRSLPRERCESEIR